ncbi:oxidoreductase [Portibacter lacus]|uniref:Oxidoreductase n=2 Tax=Portibacter lacus TaxID=1099794 RepID=A0AA37WFQ3_9BACT|nr:oxidoreductase [Portibacter lacus]
MLVEFGKANLIQKARKQPDKVKMVLDKIKADGLMPTLETVFNKLGQPLPLGYCNVGTVIGIGEEVTGFSIGDRVASNGPHAEFVSIPQNLCAIIPDQVTDDEAAFTVIGSIGLQGIRLLKPTFGETIVVTGLGLIGLITAQLLKANGCNVIGLDVDDSKLKLAESFGIKTFNPLKADPIKAVMSLTNGIGADGVIISASSKSDDIISQAAQMSRKRGRIILVGVIGLNLSRAEFYEKELTFQVSCSYGPGRYDDDYEQKGKDYPLPFVRWTEKRNFEALLNAIASKNIIVDALITEKIPLDNYLEIYGQIGKSNSVASLLIFSESSTPTSKVQVTKKEKERKEKALAIVGAGNFTKMTMLPVLKNADIKYIVSKGGLSAKSLADKYKIEFSSSDYNDLLLDKEVSTIIITTRHNLHADMAIKAIESGKNVFVEKPLALNQNELNQIIEAKEKFGVNVTVGFNRRFSPHVEKIKQFTPTSARKNMIATMNAGFIPENVWIHDLKVGGGRIIGEACHFIDLLAFISGSEVSSICMNALGTNPETTTDNASILLKFKNGDTGVINYFSNGSKAYSKERLEVYFDEKTIIMDNYRVTRAYGIKGFSKFKSKLDKGHKKQFELLSKNPNLEGELLIPFEDIVNTTKASFAAIESLKNNAWVSV